MEKSACIGRRRAKFSITVPIEEGISPAECVSRCLPVFVFMQRSYLVSRWHPSSLLNKLLGVLVNLRSSLNDFVNSSLLPWSRTLDVAQGLFKTSQFHLNLALCLFSVFQCNLLEAFDSLQLFVYVVCLWLE